MPIPKRETFEDHGGYYVDFDYYDADDMDTFLRDEVVRVLKEWVGVAGENLVDRTRALIATLQGEES